MRPMNHRKIEKGDRPREQSINVFSMGRSGDGCWSSVVWFLITGDFGTGDSVEKSEGVKERWVVAGHLIERVQGADAHRPVEDGGQGGTVVNGPSDIVATGDYRMGLGSNTGRK